MKNLITTVAALATLAFTYQPADACTPLKMEPAFFPEPLNGAEVN